MQRLPHQRGLNESALFPKRVFDLAAPERMIACPKLQICRRHHLRLNSTNIAANGDGVGGRFIKKMMAPQPETRDFLCSQISHAGEANITWDCSFLLF